MTTVRAHWLLVTIMALMTFFALLGWGAYAYSARLSATFAEQRGERDEAIARITADRDALVTAQERLLSEQQRLITEQQRLQNELALANAQLAIVREEAAPLTSQEEAAEESDNRPVGSIEPLREAAQKPSHVAKAPSRLVAPIAEGLKARCPPDQFWRVSLRTCVSKKALPQHYTIRSAAKGVKRYHTE